ncbi:MAG TPA: cbb3-type cytochrome c oxidase N-terminal domain-containing protein [Ignavibacteriaceae bacterium]|nr:cbb3-type cytochrome c oxidase N-terminal domain-containing protein [Ignavibacteriaceae bacterium]
MINNYFTKAFNRLSLAIISGFTLTPQVFAEGESDFSSTYYETVAIVLLLIIFIALLSIIYFESKEKPLQKRESIFARFRQFITRSAPIEKESEIMFEHAYDGIRELDNKVPPWFSWLFYITIIFAVYYMLDYHVFETGKLMYDEYNEEMSLASFEMEKLKKSGALLNEDNVTELTEAAALESGKTIFNNNCIACHAADGGGLVGPNLTDDYWIHGGGIKNIFKVIKYGVPEKGMISWQTQLNASQIQQVASFILSLHGTKPAAPKNPEGDLWQEPEEPVIQ